MRDRYQNKTPFWRFFHKYTGFITIGIITPIILVAWFVYDDSQVFFENWTCGMIYEMDTVGLNFEETKRHAEIIQECNSRPIQYQTDRPMDDTIP